jgi:hypothetical protein
VKYPAAPLPAQAEAVVEAAEAAEAEVAEVAAEAEVTYKP